MNDIYFLFDIKMYYIFIFSIMGGGLNSLILYGQYERLLALFKKTNGNILKCISMIKKEDKNNYNMLAIFFWENKKDLFIIIENILSKINIKINFTDGNRIKEEGYGGLVWTGGKSEFFCSKCNSKISYNILRKNIKENNIYECNKCNLEFNKINKLEIDKNIFIDL